MKRSIYGNYKVRRANFLGLLLIVGFQPTAQGAQSDTRFGPNRPSDVRGLHLIKLDPKMKYLQLAWSPNKKLEKVDRYAIYMFDPGSHGDPPEGVLFKVLSALSIKILLVPGAKETPKQGYENYFGYFAGVSEDFWVIAHNKSGWSNNDQYTLNPDENYAEYRKIISTSPNILTQPKELVITFPK